jgi:uncharacterized protein YkwD
MSRVRKFFGVLSITCLAHCATRIPQRPWQTTPIEVPDEALVYLTDARAEAAAQDGSPELAAQVAGELAKRGDKAVADGALTATARWLLNQALQRRRLGPTSTDAASRHFGFAGVLSALAVYDKAHPDEWRDTIARIPKNALINRFGISASPTGQVFAVIYGSVALDFEPIARFVDPGTSIHLRGKVDRRYALARVFLTKPDGTVEQRDMASQKLDYVAALTTRGRYKLEVMADGPMGPVVISNIPLFAGIKEPPLEELASQSSSPGGAEARMLELLNQARMAAGLTGVQADAELRSVALGHSKDMAEHEFVGHVSPSTGTAQQRLARSGILVGEAAENIAEAPTPEAAHDGLMESPGHRSAMLGATYTHVGIAAVEHNEGLIVTLLFARRPDPAKLPRDASQVETALLALRAAKGLPRPAVDPIYARAAQHGVQAYLNASKPTAEVATRATVDAIRTEISRLRTPRPAASACTFFFEMAEVEQLERTPALVAPGLVKYGLGAQLHTDHHGTRLTTVIVLEGAPCQQPR